MLTHLFSNLPAYISACDNYETFVYNLLGRDWLIIIYYEITKKILIQRFLNQFQLGAQVMLTRNLSDHHVNGQRGIVFDMQEDHVLMQVRFYNGPRV